MPGLVAWATAACTLRDVQRDAEAGAVELIGEFGALEREPANHVRAEGEGKAVRVPRGQASRSKRCREAAGATDATGAAARIMNGNLSGDAGHEFPFNRMTEPEKRAVLEFLKQL